MRSLSYFILAGQGFAAGHDPGVRRLHVLRHQRAARPPQPLRALPRRPQHRVRRRLSVRRHRVLQFYRSTEHFPGRPTSDNMNYNVTRARLSQKFAQNLLMWLMVYFHFRLKGPFLDTPVAPLGTYTMDPPPRKSKIREEGNRTSFVLLRALGRPQAAKEGTLGEPR